MQQSLSLKLVTSEEDDILLTETMKEYNKACNYVVERVFGQWLSEYKEEVQKIVYYDVRRLFNLPAQSAIRVIAKVVETCKSSYTKFEEARVLAAATGTEAPQGPIKPKFKELGGIQYDVRNSTVSIDKVFLTTLNGRKPSRLILKTHVGEYQRSRFQKKDINSGCTLIRKNGVYYLNIVREVPEKPEYDPVGVLGVDLGIKNIAVDSDRQIWRSGKIEKVRRRYSKLRAALQKVGTRSAKRKLKRLRAALQKVGTRSAKRKLKRLSGKERRFKKNVSHCVVNQIISKAKGTLRAIAIEDLKGIRSSPSGLTVGRENRDRQAKWTFGETRDILEYQSKIEGVPLRTVDPDNTSRECPNPKCRYIDKRNRKSRDLFQCIKCGCTEIADFIGAINIASRVRPNSYQQASSNSLRVAVNQPNSSVSFYDSYKPR